MRILLLTFLLAGCAPTPTIVKPVPVEVTKYIKTPIPPELIQPTVVTEPAPACGAFCNGQLAVMLADYRAGLNACNADKAALRDIQ